MFCVPQGAVISPAPVHPPTSDDDNGTTAGSSAGTDTENTDTENTDTENTDTENTDTEDKDTAIAGTENTEHAEHGTKDTSIWAPGMAMAALFTNVDDNNGSAGFKAAMHRAGYVLA